MTLPPFYVPLARTKISAAYCVHGFRGVYDAPPFFSRDMFHLRGQLQIAFRVGCGPHPVQEVGATFGTPLYVSLRIANGLGFGAPFLAPFASLVKGPEPHTNHPLNGYGDHCVDNRAQVHH